jgi:hypothetical protein
MKRIRITGACLVAALVIGAAGATTASAFAPNWGANWPKTRLKKPVFISSTTTITTETLVIVYCKDDFDNGQLYSDHAIGGAKFVFSKCESAKATGILCNSKGAEPGEVVTEPVMATLGWINKAKGEVGLQLKPEKAGGLLAKFECGKASKREIRGSAIAPITPVNTPVAPTEAFTSAFAQSEGKQTVASFEGEPAVSLETSVNKAAFEKAGIESTEEIKPDETLEISTSPRSYSPPEYGQCIKVPAGAGEFSSSKCTVEEAGGSYEWLPGPGPKVGFATALKSATTATLETKSGAKVTCTGLGATGKYTGLRTVSVSQTDFSGCESSGIKCNTTGAGTGIVKLKSLEGELGIITKGETAAKNKIGNVLWPTGGTPTSGSEFVEFACGGLTVKVKNSVISPVTANAMKLTATIKYTASKGVQKPTKFEGGPNMFLESKFSAAPYEQSGQAATTVQTNEEQMEVNTVF